MGVGFVSNKITRSVAQRSSASRLKRVLITLALYGISRALVKNPEVNRYFGKRIAHNVFG
jgi:hypothetical protein